MTERISTIPNITPTPSESPAAPDLSGIELERLLADPAALRDLARGKLVQILHSTTKPTTALVPAIKELLDRIDGKPSQSVALTVKDEGLSKIATDKLIRLAAMLDEPLVIPPMPGKLELETVEN